MKDKNVIVLYFEEQGHLKISEFKVTYQSSRSNLSCRLLFILNSYILQFDMIAFDLQWCLFVGPSSPRGGNETGTVG